MKSVDYILIHHSPMSKNTVFHKGMEYTYEEYFKLIDRKQHRKLQIKNAVLLITFGVAIVFRSYVFFEYGV